MRAFGVVPEAVHACTSKVTNIPHALTQCELVLHHMHAWYSKESKSCIVWLSMDHNPRHLQLPYIPRCMYLQPYYKVFKDRNDDVFWLEGTPKAMLQSALGFGLFSFVIDYMGNQAAPPAAAAVAYAPSSSPSLPSSSSPCTYPASTCRQQRQVWPP